jgi:nucleotide-binding universal stress UspA family protein
VDDPVLVGVDEHEQCRDAVALGAALARALQAELVLVHVYPYDPLAGSLALGAPAMDPLAEEARALLERITATLDGEARTIAVPATSTVRGLHDTAEREQAQLLVVGSGRGGLVGAIRLGRVSERVLHAAPCPVAVTPRGLAARPWQPATIAVGFDGSEEARLAVDWGRRLAEATGARLRLVAVAGAQRVAWDPYEHSPDWPLYEELRRAELERQTSAVAGRLGVVEVPTSDPEQTLVALSREADLLVLGSPRYGPARRVLLGGTAERVVRQASCPVVVVPRAEARDA